jgi:hypothetical protein
MITALLRLTYKKQNDLKKHESSRTLRVTLALLFYIDVHTTDNDRYQSYTPFWLFDWYCGHLHKSCFGDLSLLCLRRNTVLKKKRSFTRIYTVPLCVGVSGCSINTRIWQAFFPSISKPSWCSSHALLLTWYFFFTKPSTTNPSRDQLITLMTMKMRAFGRYSAV